MKIYNTLTRKKEEFIPLNKNEVRMYTCGPTVYNFIHIGNARPICVFDTLRRYFEYRGNKVIFVQNFTDVDDKIIKKANEEGLSFTQVAEKYIEEYKTDARGLNVKEASYHPKATDNIANIIDFVQHLIDNGYAYESNGDVYFRTKSFNEYGKLSHMPLEDLEAGARIDVSEQKEDPMDFALWKAAKPDEPFWDSPWGKGRPGWHIECSTMARSILGDTIDIHCGGQDLVFPHHENEIAQSECATGKPFARYWMHNGYINVDNKKMSKSLGNFFTTREVANKYGYEPIRYIMISAHYRTPINYSIEVIEQAKAALERLYTCRDNLEFTIANAQESGANIDEKLLSYKQKFIDAMEDDLNTADALSVVFDLAREINIITAGVAEYSKLCYENALKLFNELTEVLGILYVKKDDSIESEIEELIKQRQDARKSKDFKTADEIRDKLKDMGIILEDTPMGVKWHKA